MSSKVTSQNTDDSIVWREDTADFFANNKLKLGDKTNGNGTLGLGRVGETVMRS